MRPDDLSLDQLKILDRLVHAPLAWQSPGEVAGFLDDEARNEALADLEASGWLAPWETDDGIDLTLTPIAAEILGVHLVEVGEDELPCWSPIAEPEPPLPPAKGIFEKYAALALVVDPSPGPIEVLIAAESVTVEASRKERRKRRDQERRAEARSIKACAKRRLLRLRLKRKVA